MDSNNSSKEKLLAHEKKAYYEIFKMLDIDKKGSFGVNELSRVMKSFGIAYNEKEVKRFEQEVLEMILVIDTTGNGRISFEEFLDVFLKTIKDTNEAEEELREAFKVFDKEGNGFVPIIDLRKAMTEIGERLSEEEFEDMLRELELENDQYLNYEEFITILSSAHK